MTDVIDTLISIGALVKDNIVTARKGTTNKFGMISYVADDYVLQSISNDGHSAMFSLKQANGTNEITVASEDITAIDGMNIDRYADIYNVKPDGTMRTTGRKRGRKPKIRN